MAVSYISASVMQGPFILLQESVDYFFHRQVRDQLILRQTHARDWVKVTDPLEMFLDVFSFVCNPTGRDHWLLQDLEANLATQIIGYLSFLQKKCINKMY